MQECLMQERLTQQRLPSASENQCAFAEPLSSPDGNFLRLLVNIRECLKFATP